MATCYSTAVRRSASRAASRPPVILRVRTPARRASWTPTLCSAATEHERARCKYTELTEANSCERLRRRHIKRRRATVLSYRYPDRAALIVTPIDSAATAAGVAGSVRPRGPPLAAPSSRRRRAMIDVFGAAPLVAVTASVKASSAHRRGLLNTPRHGELRRPIGNRSAFPLRSVLADGTHAGSTAETQVRWSYR